jgi:hypothetical protein
MNSTTGTGRWIVPFKGRNHSGPVQQNFLWRDARRPVYIMDNHRAAMWCWLQEMRPDERLNLLHIDEHFDTLSANIERWMKELPSLDSISIEDYLLLETKTAFGPTPLIRWDTYLSLFLGRYRDRLGRCIFATHNNGDRPLVDDAWYPEVYALANNAAHWIETEKGRWIVNVDLDYFFIEMNGKHAQMVSAEYLDTLFDGLGRQLAQGRIGALTVCLTPDEAYTGGWEPAEAMCRKVCSHLGVQFELPEI